MKWYPGHHMTESIVHIFHIECLGWSHYSFFLASPALDGSHNCLISSSVGLTKVVSFASLSASSTSLFFDFSPAVGCFLSWLGWEVAEDGEDAEEGFPLFTLDSKFSVSDTFCCLLLLINRTSDFHISWQYEHITSSKKNSSIGCYWTVVYRCASISCFQVVSE